MDDKIFNQYKIAATICQKALDIITNLCINNASCYKISLIGNEYIKNELSKQYKKLKKGFKITVLVLFL